MQVTHGKLFFSFTLIASVSLSCLTFQIIRRHQHPAQNDIAEQNNIEATLTKLQSRDESDVLEAKAELVEMGGAAIELLISLLRELTNKTVEPNPSTVDSVLEQSRQSRDPHTKSTSENAIYEVLGQLHAAEAVPLLVTIMEEEEVHDMIQGMSPVMRGLAEIGPAAVPRLVESIDTAASKAKALLSSGLSEERRQSDLIQEGRIELRATLVLRAIGDPRAIPALERLQQATNNWFIAREAREAVESIQNRTLR